MLGKCTTFLFILMILVASAPAAILAQSAENPGELAANARLDSPPEYRAITKVKPSPTQPATPLKVKPSGLMSGIAGLSRYNPVTWGPECYLPVPAKGQFVVGPRINFMRVRGEVRRGLDIAGAPATTVDFDDQLGLEKSGKPVWSIEAFYQFRPRWGIKYSFMPLVTDATHSPKSSFTFMGQNFAALTPINSKWEHYEHRAGLVFNISQTTNSLTSFFAEWLYIQDKLSVTSTTGTATSATWNTHKSAAVAGLQFEKCLKNYHGNTLALNAKGGLAFMSDTFGYEGEVGLNYMIPIKTGRFGYVKGGYRYEHLKKERTVSMFNTTLDGPFIEVGFLF
jgi:hypothetical protein